MVLVMKYISNVIVVYARFLPYFTVSTTNQVLGSSFFNLEITSQARFPAYLLPCRDSQQGELLLQKISFFPRREFCCGGASASSSAASFRGGVIPGTGLSCTQFACSHSATLVSMEESYCGFLVVLLLLQTGSLVSVYITDGTGET